MKPERDPVTCSNTYCTDEATTATPAGPMCAECSAVLAESEL